MTYLREAAEMDADDYDAALNKAAFGEWATAEPHGTLMASAEAPVSDRDQYEPYLLPLMTVVMSARFRYWAEEHG